MKKLLILIIFALFVPFKIFAFDSSATSTILMDMDSGRILYSNNIHTSRSVASISKIMTAIVAIESGKLQEEVIVGEEINKAYGSGIYIRQGEHIKLEDLLYGLMLRSGNDAALAIANYVGGNINNFVEMMNQKSISLGMKNTTFNNPSGLDQEKGNYSTAYDMAILTSYAMKNETYKKIVSTKKHTVKTDVNYYSWTNKNKLLHSYKYCTGGKTGFTEKARRTLVTTASRDNLNLVVVTLNDGNDFLDHKNLFEEAFSKYTNYEIIKSGDITIPGEEYYKEDNLYLKNSFTYPFSIEENPSIKLKYNLNKLKKYQNGDNIGNIDVYIGDDKINSFPIYVRKKQEIEEKQSIIKKMIDWFKKIW